MNKIIEDWKQSWPELFKADFNDITNYIYEFWSQARCFSAGSNAEKHKIEQIQALCQVYLNKSLKHYIPAKDTPFEAALKHLRDNLVSKDNSKLDYTLEPSIWNELKFPETRFYTFLNGHTIEVVDIVAINPGETSTGFKHKDGSVTAVNRTWISVRIKSESPNPT